MCTKTHLPDLDVSISDLVVSKRWKSRYWTDALETLSAHFSCVDAICELNLTAIRQLARCAKPSSEADREALP